MRGGGDGNRGRSSRGSRGRGERGGDSSSSRGGLRSQCSANTTLARTRAGRRRRRERHVWRQLRLVHRWCPPRRSRCGRQGANKASPRCLRSWRYWSRSEKISRNAEVQGGNQTQPSELLLEENFTLRHGFYILRLSIISGSSSSSIVVRVRSGVMVQWLQSSQVLFLIPELQQQVPNAREKCSLD